VIRVELASCFTYVLNWKLCIYGKGDLAWAYARCDNICFNNKIKVEEHRVNSIKKLNLESNIIFSMGSKSQSKIEANKPLKSYPFVFLHL